MPPKKSYPLPDNLHPRNIRSVSTTAGPACPLFEPQTISSNSSKCSFPYCSDRGCTNNPSQAFSQECCRDFKAIRCFALKYFGKESPVEWHHPYILSYRIQLYSPDTQKKKEVLGRLYVLYCSPPISNQAWSPPLREQRDHY